jgi:mono/diheme cytochrome c family protein
MGRGFRLPEGDVERGKTAFIELNCHHCHTVAGLELPKPEIPAGVSFELGGVVRTVKSYGQLVTAITQPQHIVSADYLARIEKARRDGTASPMPSFNEQMTVSQLTDIVTFLHSHYRKAPPPGMNYPQYMP